MEAYGFETSQKALAETQNLAFAASLSELATRLPEVAEHQAAIEQAGNVITEELGLQPEFFNDASRTFFFSAIAQRYASLEDLKTTMTVDQYTTEKEFIFDATVLLAGDKSSLYPETKNLIDSDQGASDKVIETVYNRFINKEVSKELEEAIEGGLLANVKERLGVNKDNEDPFKVQVLNIGDEFTTLGMRPDMPDLSDKKWNGPEWQDWNYTQAAFKGYGAELTAKGKEFKRQLGTEGNIPPAWITKINGVNTLNLPLPVAEKILYRDQERSRLYADDDAARDFAILEHEYTHTQGGLNLDNNIFFGIGLEELRAEHFSGNKQGYLQIKGFFADLKIVTGINFPELMSQEIKGGDAPEFYTALAEQLGLQNVLEIALTVPSPYIDKKVRPLQAHISTYLGGADAVTERIFNQVTENDPKRQEAIDAYIDDWATRNANLNSESWASYRKQTLGLQFVTSKLEARLREKRAGAEQTTR